MSFSHLILITSCLDTKYPSNVFSLEERYNQTINTLLSVKKNFPNSTIFFIEASQASNYMKEEIQKLCDIYYDISSEQETIQYCIEGNHKSLGDSYITLKGVEYINANKLIFDVYHKLSGRYYIGDDFKLELIDKEIPTFKDSTHNPGNNIMTCFYSIPYAYLNEYHTNIMNTVHFMKYRSDVPVEDYFPNLFKTKKLIPWEMKIGIYGIVAPCTQRITQIW